MERDKCSKEFISHLADIRDYWLKTGKELNYDTETIVNGTIFSILVFIDGNCSLNDFHQIKIIDSYTGERLDCGYLHELYSQFGGKNE